MGISVTVAAQKEIKRQMAETQLDPSLTHLKIRIVGGGCSGLTYELEFGDAPITSHDIVFEKEETEERMWGFRVVTDLESFKYLDGTVIDFIHEGLITGFRLKNPHVHACGCGHSFAPSPSPSDSK